MSKQVLDVLQRQFPSAIATVHSQAGDDTAVVTREAIADVSRFLKESPELAFTMPLDVTAVDYSHYPEPRPCPTRFEVVYHVRSLKLRTHLRLKVRVAAEDPTVPSLTSVWRGVEWAERETYDMFGIQFTNHPDLRRILLYPEFLGHPLRKDYPVRGYQPLMNLPTLRGDPVPGVSDPEEP
jgi:NADH-quinone oxidoreductase subunit C